MEIRLATNYEEFTWLFEFWGSQYWVSKISINIISWQPQTYLIP